jgi:tetratricopeptide (TPR) repeat protein
MRHHPAMTILLLTVALILVLPARAQQKPLTQDQVQGLVRDGLGDETGAKAIQQRGIDFAPTEDFFQSLKRAGASEAFLQALRAAKQTQPAGETSEKPLTQVQVIALVAAQLPKGRVAQLVGERGLDFDPSDEYLRQVSAAGGDNELISALKSAKVMKPANVDPVLQARQAEIQQRVARGAEFFQNKQYAEAEREYRAAVLLDPQNAEVHVSLGVALAYKGAGDGAIAQFREALRLNPDNEMAHVDLGVALGSKGDWAGEITEERAALRLNPNNDVAHADLGVALGSKGDWDGEIAEERAALRLNPNNENAHVSLGVALGSKGDWDGEIAEMREALRLNPNNPVAHSDLGIALGSKGDWDGEIAEEREALRLNPNNEAAHFALGVALGSKGDWAGEIAEEHEALRLNPNNAFAHFCLGVALENSGHPLDALREYGAAYKLNPQNNNWLDAYQRLLQRVKR